MASPIWIGVSTLWVSTFLYGIYLVLFCRCLSLFSDGRLREGRSQSILLASAIVMFLLSTASVVIFLMHGAVLYGSGGLKWRPEDLEVASALVYVTNNVVGDALLIYRCYVIWNTLYIVIVPSLLLVATMILGYTIQLKLFFILSLTTNLLIPTLVAVRLWWILRRIRGTAGAETRRKGRRAMTIILESGLIYSIVVSIHMVFFHYDDPMDQIVYAALGQVVGIVPTLIIVRVGRGMSSGGCAAGSTMVDSMSAASVTMRGPGSIIVPGPGSGAGPIMVHIEHDVDVERDGKERSRWEVDSPV